MKPAAEIYENHLKDGYVVPKDGASLLITDTSCYKLGAEAAWLVSVLPPRGSKSEFLAALLGLGLEDPEKIFDRLLALGALKEVRKRNWKEAAGRALAPRVRLIPAQLQEKLFGAVGLNSDRLAGIIGPLTALAAGGVLWGLAALAAGGKDPAGGVSGLTVIICVLAASLLHEVGHSAAAAAAGIGFRPIGLSIYLIYPVFYTNVSGVEKLSLGRRALIDCGGFMAQGVGLLALLLAAFFTGNGSAASAASWVTLIMLFNLNPLIKTDAYWLYKDLRSGMETRPWIKAAHGVYMAAFAAFTVYFLWQAAGRVGLLLDEAWRLLSAPSYILSGGYRAVLAAYFLLVALSGGLQRVKESGKELAKFRNQASDA